MERNIFDMEHEMFRDSVRKFLQREITPNIDAWRERGIVDREAFLKAGEQGLCLIWADEKFGGLGVDDFRFEQIIIEEMAHHGDPGFGLSLHSRLVAPYLGKLGNPEQQERFLPACVRGETILGIAMSEPAAGSDVAGLRTRAEDKGDHFLLNGSKTY
ncbi:MAG: acyl-CoA dehydrogenase family protein, partial [Gammaproteobacteria bacterium]